MTVLNGYNGCMLTGVGAHREAREMGGPGLGHAGKQYSFVRQQAVCLFVSTFWNGVENEIRVQWVQCPLPEPCNTYWTNRVVL